MKSKLLTVIAIAFIAIFPSFASAKIPTTWTDTYLTWYESYPTSQQECEQYGGCEWAGYFAFVNGKKSPAWVKSHKIASVYEKFGPEYKDKWLEVRVWDRTAKRYRYVRAQVLDVASDDDCHGCGITPGQLVKRYGFLLDLEINTMKALTGGKKFTGIAQYRLTNGN